MKRTARIILIMIAMFSMQSFTTTPSANETKVYVTPNGKCYHSTKNCRSLSRSKNIKAVPLSEAKKTRRACSICY